MNIQVQRLFQNMGTDEREEALEYLQELRLNDLNKIVESIANDLNRLLNKAAEVGINFIDGDRDEVWKDLVFCKSNVSMKDGTPLLHFDVSSEIGHNQIDW